MLPEELRPCKKESTKREKLKFYQCVAKCCHYYNTLQNFGLHPNFGACCGSHDWFFLSHLLVSWWFQAPLLDHKSFLCSHLYVACVIIGHRGFYFSRKGNVVLLQGKECVHEWLSSHKHVSLSLHTIFSRRLLHQAKYVLCILDGLCCDTKCPCPITIKSCHCLHMFHWSHT